MTANKEGSFGALPPVNPQAVALRPDGSAIITGNAAPQQTTVAGTERPTHDQIIAARANERDLPAFAPKPMTREQIRAMIGRDPEAVVLSARDVARQATSSIKPVDHPLPSRLRRVIRPAVGPAEPSKVDEAPKIILTDADATPVQEASPPEASSAPVETMEHEEHEPAAIEAPARSALAAAVAQIHPPTTTHQPAASNSDSPSRGVPSAVADPNKKITGGFGVPGEGPADYFPLDGTELRAVVQRLLENISSRLEDDLRFSMACTYPRVSARVEVIIEAYGIDKPMVIPRVATPRNMTKLETARKHAEEIVFVVGTEVREMTEAGESVTPTNRMRQELGLEIPHKQTVQTPFGGRMWIDRH